MKPRGRFTMSAERSAWLSEQLEKKTDWVGTCRKCGKHICGTPADIRAHKCEEAPNADGK